MNEMRDDYLEDTTDDDNDDAQNVTTAIIHKMITIHVIISEVFMAGSFLSSFW